MKKEFDKKVGPTLVLTLNDLSNSVNSDMRRNMLPEPRANYIFRVHPYETNRFVGLNIFHSVVCREKRQQFVNIFKSIGAKSIQWHVNCDWDSYYDVPQPLYNELLMISEKYTSLKHEEVWKEAVRNRLSKWSELLDVEFTYEDDFDVNDLNLDKLACTLKCSEKQRRFITGDILKSRTRRSLLQNEVYKSFTPSQDSAEITFFSKNEHKVANEQWLKKNWTAQHVIEFLRLTGREQLIDDFIFNAVDGKVLFNTDRVSFMQIYGMDATAAISLYCNIHNLAEVENLHVVFEVHKSVKLIYDSKQTISQTSPS